MSKRNKEIKGSMKTDFLHREKPRIPSLEENDFIKEVFLFRSAMDKLEYPNGENVESEWESEMHSLVQWLKSYHDNIIEDLSSFLKLEKESLSINTINSTVRKDSIKPFIRENVTIFNIIATMMNYRKLRLKWVLMASHVTYDSSLPPRDKEILILRIAWLCGSHYEWNHHVLVGKRVGLSIEEINKIKVGSEAEGWGKFNKLLLNSVDELYTN